MATVDELIIAIKADTKDLNKKLNKTNKQLKKTGKEAKKSGKNINAAFSKGKVAAAAFAAVMVKMVTAIAKVGMEFEDLRDSLNTVFGGMEAGEEAMGKVLAFAQTTPFQVEEVTKAFIQLRSVGIEPTNRMMQVFADTASTSTDQLGVFQALVRTVQRGKAGALGLMEINQLSDRGIPALKILAEQLNISKMEIAKFGATAEGAEIITDALITGLEKQFGGAMASKMDNLSTKTSNLTIALKSLGNEIYMSGLSKFLKGLADDATAATNHLAMLIAASRGAGLGIVLQSPVYTAGMTGEEIKAEKTRVANANILDMTAKLTDLKAQLDNNEIGIDAWTGKMLMMKQTLTAINPTLGGIITMIGELTESEGDNLTQREKIEKIYERLSVALGIERDTLHELLDVKKELSEEEVNGIMFRGQSQNAINLVIAALEKERGSTETLKFAEENWLDIMKQCEEQLNNLGFSSDQAKEMLGKLQEATEDVTGFTAEMQQAIVSASNAFTTDFVNSLLDGENALESFKNFSKSMVSQIIAIFLQMEVVNRLLAHIFPNFTGTVGTGLFDSPSSTLSTADADSIAAIHNIGRGTAGGGKVQKGVPTMIGERGAEIFVPNTGGTIMNNMNSKGMGGGTTVVVNQSVNFATGVVPTVRAEVQKMMPMISDVTKGAVLEAAVRGGSFKKGLMGSG